MSSHFIPEKITLIINTYFRTPKKQQEEFFNTKILPALKSIMDNISLADYEVLFQIIQPHIHLSSEASEELKGYLEEAGLQELIQKKTFTVNEPIDSDLLPRKPRPDYLPLNPRSTLAADSVEYKRQPDKRTPPKPKPKYLER